LKTKLILHMSIGTKIKKLRTQNKWSQDELAGHLEVAQTSVSNFEADKTIPDFLMMQKICSLFEVGLEYFIDDTNANITIKKAENNTNSNIGCKIDVINNNFPEGILENMLKRITFLEEKISKKE